MFEKDNNLTSKIKQYTLNYILSIHLKKNNYDIIPSNSNQTILSVVFIKDAMLLSHTVRLKRRLRAFKELFKRSPICASLFSSQN